MKPPFRLVCRRTFLGMSVGFAIGAWIHTHDLLLVASSVIASLLLWGTIAAVEWNVNDMRRTKERV